MSDGTRPLALTRRQFATGAAAGALVLAGATTPRRARAADPIRLGVLLPRSGHLSLIGQACQRGADLAVPLLADMGYAIQLVNADTESSPDVGRTQAEKLIREGVHMLMGTFDSATSAAVAQVAEQKGVPYVINIASDPPITEQGYKFVFRNFPTSIMLGVDGLGLFKSVFELSGKTPKTAVLMYVNDSFGVGMKAGVEKLTEKMNMPFKIVDAIGYDPKARDLSIEVAKAKAANAELHMVITRLNDAILMVREMVKQQYEPMGIISPGSPGMYEKQFAKSLGKYADYCITNVPWFNPKQALAKEVQERFYKQWPDQTCDLNIGYTFEAVLIAADAYKRAGSTDPKALVEALRATSIDKRVMTGGAIQFDAKGQNVHNKSAAVQNLAGEPRVVLPADIADAKLVFPMPGWKARGA